MSINTPDGCPWCRSWRQWPEKIGSSFQNQSTLHRCSKCGTYWESPATSYPHPISREVALDLLSQPQPVDFRVVFAGLEPLLDAAELLWRGSSIGDRRGAIRWQLSSAAGRYGLERPGGEQIAGQMLFPALQVCLALEIGAEARSMRGLAPIAMPTARGSEAPGYRVSCNEDGYLLSLGGEHLATFPRREQPVAYSHAHALGVDELVTLYLAP
jgi:hypothetical protein